MALATGTRSWRGVLPLGVFLALSISGLSAADDPQQKFSQVYTERAAQLNDQDARGWLALADFCEQNQLARERLEALRKVIAIEPGNQVARQRLGEVRAGNDWLSLDDFEAKQLEERGAKGLTCFGKKWLTTKEADKRIEAERKQLGWNFTNKVECDGAVIYSDAAPIFSMKLVRLINNFTAAYRKAFAEPLGIKRKPVQVTIFVTRYESLLLEFHKHFAPQGAPPLSSPCMFYSDRKLMLLLVLGGGDFSFDTFVREYSMVLDELLLGVPRCDLPGWLTNGRADYLAFSRQGLQFFPGLAAPPPWRTAVHELKKNLGTVPLRQVLAASSQEFTGPSFPANHGIAWGFVQYLMHGDAGRNLPGFRRYLKNAVDHKGTQVEDLEKALGKKFPEIELNFTNYCRNFLMPRAFVNQGFTETGVAALPEPGQGTYVAAWQANPKDITTKRYMNMLVFIKVDEAVSPAEEKFLAERAEQMKLTKEDTAQLAENPMVKQQQVNFQGRDLAEQLAFFRDMIEASQADGTINDRELGGLRMVKQQFGQMLSDEQFEQMLKPPPAPAPAP